MAKVEIKHSGAATHIFVDGKEVHFVREYTLHQSVGTIPEIILELNLSDHKNEHSLEYAKVQYSEDTIRQAISVLRAELLKRGELYDGFHASIKSVLNDYGYETCCIEDANDEIAYEILKRLIGA